MKYTGILNVPMTFGPARATSGEELHWEFLQDRPMRSRGLLNLPTKKDIERADFLARFHALFDWYGISFEDEHKWMKLSVELARAHVPGFSKEPVPKRGAPIKHTYDTDLRLLEDIAKLVNSPGNMTPHGACKNLVKREPYKGKNDRTLYRRYLKIKNLRASKPSGLLFPWDKLLYE